jgi:hypothetical protein
VNLQFCTTPGYTRINPVNLFGQTWSSPRISCVFIIAAKHTVEHEVVLGFLWSQTSIEQVYDETGITDYDYIVN